MLGFWHWRGCKYLFIRKWWTTANNYESARCPTRNRPGLEEIMAIGEKLSCSVRRTSGELGRCPLSDRLNIANAVFTSQHCKVCYHISGYNKGRSIDTYPQHWDVALEIWPWCTERWVCVRSNESRETPVGGRQLYRAGGTQLSCWYWWLNGAQQLVPILKHLIILEWWRWHTLSPHSNLI